MRLIPFLLISALAKPALAEPPSVVTDIAPIHGLVASVMEGVESPKLLLQPGVDPHSYSLRPSEARALADADLVFWIGPELTPWLSKSLVSLSTQASIISLLHEVKDKALEFRSGAHGDPKDEHDATHKDDHDAHEDAHGHAHDEHGEDPHAWLDPDIALIWLDHIQDELSKADPEHAATYAQNASLAKTRISSAIQDITAQLSHLDTVSYFASHDSYQYFERHFALSMVGSIALSDAVKPGPKRLQDMKKLAEESDATCLAVDVVISRDLIRTVLEGTDLFPTTVDPLGFDIPPGPAFYPTLITSVADAFASCLKGDT